MGQKYFLKKIIKVMIMKFILHQIIVYKIFLVDTILNIYFLEL
jgi:hypothetical protein